MGNLCGKESPSDPFSQPGRTLSSTPPNTAPKISSVPKAAKVGGPPRTLGSAITSSQPTPQGNMSAEDARRNAAAAAERRANEASKSKGKLGSQLKEQQKKTRIDTLEGASKDELRMRDADAGAEARAYN